MLVMAGLWVLKLFFPSVLCKRCSSFPHPSICLVWVIAAAAAVGAVAAFGHVQEGVLTRVQLGYPFPRNQEGGQVKQIHKHLVAIAGKTYSGSWIRCIKTFCTCVWVVLVQEMVCILLPIHISFSIVFHMDNSNRCRELHLKTGFVPDYLAYLTVERRYW